MAKPAKPAEMPVHVTRLEMTAPPRASLSVPVNRNIAVMRVPSISPAFYRYLYNRVGRRWFWVDRLRMKDADLSAILEDPRTQIAVLYVDGEPAGFYELFIEEGFTADLVHFGLMERALGLGVGKWFLLQALYTAWASTPQKVTVTTNNLDHPRALQLYQMFGFEPVATEDVMLTPLSDKEILEIAKRI